jgi:hypothetical protein
MNFEVRTYLLLQRALGLWAGLQDKPLARAMRPAQATRAGDERNTSQASLSRAMNDKQLTLSTRLLQALIQVVSTLFKRILITARLHFLIS